MSVTPAEFCYMTGHSNQWGMSLHDDETCVRCGYTDTSTHHRLVDLDILYGTDPGSPLHHDNRNCPTCN